MGATEYRLIDEAGRDVYVGSSTSAFVSGLPDGSFQFRVRAYDSSDTLIGEGGLPMTVQVNHWSLLYAAILFLIGLTVVAAVVWVIVTGALRDRAHSMPAQDHVGVGAA